MVTRTGLISLAILGALLAAPAPAAAQAAGGQAAVSAEKKKIAEDEFAKGKKLFAAGKYLEAAAAFSKAYEAAPHPAVLANIGLCYDKAGRYPEAVDYYRRYIADPASAGKNAEVRQRLQELKGEVGELDIECPAAGCAIRIDGVDRGPAPVSAVVEPGSHKVEAVVDGEVRESVLERADAGTIVRVRLRAEKAAPAPAAPPEPTAPPPPAAPPPEREISLGVPFWIAGGITVAAGATAIAFGALTLKERDDYEASGYTDADAKSTGERDRLITNVMIGVTAAAAATAVAFAIHDVFFSAPEPEADGAQPDAAAEVAIVPAGAGIAVVGAF